MSFLVYKKFDVPKSRSVKIPYTDIWYWDFVLDYYFVNRYDYQQADTIGLVEGQIVDATAIDGEEIMRGDALSNDELTSIVFRLIQSGVAGLFTPGTGTGGASSASAVTFSNTIAKIPNNPITIQAAIDQFAIATNTKLNALSPASGANIAPLSIVMLAGGLWRNPTTSPIAVPATISAATLIAAGLEQFQGVTVEEVKSAVTSENYTDLPNGGAIAIKARNRIVTNQTYTLAAGTAGAWAEIDVVAGAGTATIAPTAPDKIAGTAGSYIAAANSNLRFLFNSAASNWEVYGASAIASASGAGLEYSNWGSFALSAGKMRSNGGTFADYITARIGNTVVLPVEEGLQARDLSTALGIGIVAPITNIATGVKPVLVRGSSGNASYTDLQVVPSGLYAISYNGIDIILDPIEGASALAVAASSRNLPIFRSNPAQNVAPTAAEFPNPTTTDSAQINLNGTGYEDWSYSTGAWVKLGSMIPAPDGRNLPIFRSTATPNVAPTAAEFPSPTVKDSAHINLNGTGYEDWSYSTGAWVKLGSVAISNDGRSLPIFRTATTQNVAPTATEFPSPTVKDTAQVNLNGSGYEDWSYSTGAWVKIGSMIPSVTTGDGTTRLIIRSNSTVDVAPTAIEFPSPTVKDYAIVNLNGAGREDWSYSTGAWVKIGSLLMSGAGRTRLVFRSNPAPNVAPTATEFPTPTASDFAQINLNGTGYEDWSYSTGAWVKIGSVSIQSDGSTRLIYRSNVTEDTAPTAIEFPSPTTKDYAIVNLNNTIEEQWSYATGSWVKLGKLSTLSIDHPGIKGSETIRPGESRTLTLNGVRCIFRWEGAANRVVVSDVSTNAFLVAELQVPGWSLESQSAIPAFVNNTYYPIGFEVTSASGYLKRLVDGVSLTADLSDTAKWQPLGTTPPVATFPTATVAGVAGLFPSVPAGAASDVMRRDGTFAAIPANGSLAGTYTPSATLPVGTGLDAGDYYLVSADGAAGAPFAGVTLRSGDELVALKNAPTAAADWYVRARATAYQAGTVANVTSKDAIEHTYTGAILNDAIVRVDNAIGSIATYSTDANLSYGTSSNRYAISAVDGNLYRAKVATVADRAKDPANNSAEWEVTSCIAAPDLANAENVKLGDLRSASISSVRSIFRHASTTPRTTDAAAATTGLSAELANWELVSQASIPAFAAGTWYPKGFEVSHTDGKFYKNLANATAVLADITDPAKWQVIGITSGFLARATIGSGDTSTLVNLREYIGLAGASGTASPKLPTAGGTAQRIEFINGDGGTYTIGLATATDKLGGVTNGTIVSSRKGDWLVFDSIATGEWVEVSKKTQYDTAVGSVLAWPGAAVPDDGWLPLSGGVYNKVDYPELAALIDNNSIAITASKTATTFTLKNYNTGAPGGLGYFLGGLGGQTAGTLQDDATAVNGLRDTGHFHANPTQGEESSTGSLTPGGGASSGTYNTNSATANLVGDTETRPYTARVLWCVRAKPQPLVLGAGATLNINSQTIRHTVTFDNNPIGLASEFTWSLVRIPVTTGMVLDTISCSIGSGYIVDAIGGMVGVIAPAGGGTINISKTERSQTVAVTLNGAAMSPAVAVVPNQWTTLKIPVAVGKQIATATIAGGNVSILDPRSGLISIRVSAAVDIVTTESNPSTYTGFQTVASGETTLLLTAAAQSYNVGTVLQDNDRLTIWGDYNNASDQTQILSYWVKPGRTERGFSWPATDHNINIVFPATLTNTINISHGAGNTTFRVKGYRVERDAINGFVIPTGTEARASATVTVQGNAVNINGGASATVFTGTSSRAYLQVPVGQQIASLTSTPANLASIADPVTGAIEIACPLGTTAISLNVTFKTKETFLECCYAAYNNTGSTIAMAADTAYVFNSVAFETNDRGYTSSQILKTHAGVANAGVICPDAGYVDINVSAYVNATPGRIRLEQYSNSGTLKQSWNPAIVATAIESLQDRDYNRVKVAAGDYFVLVNNTANQSIWRGQNHTQIRIAYVQSVAYAIPESTVVAITRQVTALRVLTGTLASPTTTAPANIDGGATANAQETWGRMYRLTLPADTEIDGVSCTNGTISKAGGDMVYVTAGAGNPVVTFTTKPLSGLLVPRQISAATGTIENGQANITAYQGQGRSIRLDIPNDTEIASASISVGTVNVIGSGTVYVIPGAGDGVITYTTRSLADTLGLGYLRLVSDISGTNLTGNLGGNWAAENGFTNTIAQAVSGPSGGTPGFLLKAGKRYRLRANLYGTGVDGSEYLFVNWYNKTDSADLPATSMGGLAYDAATGGREPMGHPIEAIVIPTKDIEVVLRIQSWSGTFNIAAESTTRSTSIFAEELPLYYRTPNGFTQFTTRSISGSVTAFGRDNTTSSYVISVPANQELDTVTAAGGSPIIEDRRSGRISLTPNGADIAVTHTTRFYARTLTANVNINGVSGTTGVTVEVNKPTIVLVVPGANQVIGSATITNGTVRVVDIFGAIEVTPNNAGDPVLNVTYASRLARIFTTANAGTAVNFNTLQFLMPASGNRSIQIRSNTGANVSFRHVSWLAWDNAQALTSGTVNTSWAYLNSNWNFTIAGQIQQGIIEDTTNNRVYRLTMQVGNAYNNNVFIIEEL